MPTSTHQHVSEQHAAAGETHQDPLAPGLDAIHGAPPNTFIKIDSRELWKDTLKFSDNVPSQGPVQRASRAKDSVALGHLRHLRCGLVVLIVRVFFVDRFYDAGNSPHVITAGRVGESGFFQKSPEWMLPCRDFIDF